MMKVPHASRRSYFVPTAFKRDIILVLRLKVLLYGQGQCRKTNTITVGTHYTIALFEDRDGKWKAQPIRAVGIVHI